MKAYLSKYVAINAIYSIATFAYIPILASKIGFSQMVISILLLLVSRRHYLEYLFFPTIVRFSI